MSFDQTTSQAYTEKPTLSSIPRHQTMTDEVSTAGRTDSEKESETGLKLQQRLNEERKHIKSSTLNEKQLMPIKRLNHSLRDAKLEVEHKTPVVTRNPKLEDLHSLVIGNTNESFSGPHKHQKGTLVLKSQGSRNHSLFSPAEDKTSIKPHPESITDKYMQRPSERDQEDSESQRMSYNKIRPQRPDFATLSFNSKRANQNRDLKESVSVI